MCVGRCSRIVGPCLLVLGTLSVVASILLLFPGGAWQYVVDGHISRRAKIKAKESQKKPQRGRETNKANNRLAHNFLEQNKPLGTVTK